MVVKQVSATRPRRVTVLGSTGSVGQSTVDLLLRNRDRFEVEALTAKRNVELLARQARELGARMAVVADPSAHRTLRDLLSGSGIETAAGQSAVVEAASRPADLVMAAIIGAAGLPAVIAAIRRGAMVAFANKETLVSAGPLVMQEVARHGARLLPVDSEHNAIFQVLQDRRSVEKLILTGSGGPFRTWTVEQMAAATPLQAIAHPNWNMGAKISVDSATMMNKGLEIIEASLLFAMPSSRIDVLIHPQSIIHSLVAYEDGSVLAQLGAPDMRTPIAHALAWPERMLTPTARLDLARIARLDFEPPDTARFPALRLAREALEVGRSAPAVLNAANEVAVEAFLAERIGFLDIVRIVEETLRRCPTKPLESLEAVAEADDEARRMARGLL